MKIAIIGPQTENSLGLSTVTRSESRLALLWAEILNGESHDVYFCSLTNGVIDGINFVPLDKIKRGGPFDVALFIEYSPQDGFQEDIRSDRKLFISFNPPRPDLAHLLPDDSMVLVPTREERLGGYRERKTGILPYLIWDNFPDKSNFSPKSIISTCRYPFQASLDEKVLDANIKHYEALLDLAESGYNLCILGLDGSNVHNKARDVYVRLLGAIKSLPNVEESPLLPVPKFRNKLTHYSVSIHGYQASASPDAVMFGLTPVVWEDYGHSFFSNGLYSALGYSKHYGQLDCSTIKSRIIRLLEDPEFHQHEHNIIKRNMPFYSTKEALNLFYSYLG